MAVRTRSELKTNIANNFADNVSGDISAEDLRNQSNDEADSFLIVGEDGHPIARGTSFPGSPDDNDFFFNEIDDILYYYDDTLSKWLSVEQADYDFGLEGPAEGRYMDVAGGVIVGQFGYNMPRAGIIVGASARGSGNATKTFQIDRSTSFNVGNFSLTDNVANEKELNITFAADDYIRVYVADDGDPVDDAIVHLFVRWSN